MLLPSIFGENLLDDGWIFQGWISEISTENSMERELHRL